MLSHYYTTSGGESYKGCAGTVATKTHKCVFYCRDGVCVGFKGPVHHSDVSGLEAAWTIGGVGTQTVHQILHIRKQLS